MPSIELSKYQKDILNFIENKKGNLLVDAKAGSGKTSTLLLIADMLQRQNKKCLFLAFNKHIAEEISLKLNNTEMCLSKTIHSLGYSFIKSYLYRKHNVNYKIEIVTDKLRNLVKEQYIKLAFSRVTDFNSDMDKADLEDLHSNLVTDLTNLCNFSRFYNVNYNKENTLKWLIPKCCFALDKHLTEVYNYQEIVKNVLDYTKYLFEHPEINEEGLPTYQIDFVDMIYFPVYYNMTIPYSIKSYLDIILIDEAQDLSILQQKFIKKLSNTNNRFIFVGDKFQAIYGFAGADINSINNIKNNFILKELPLNICYRCPENVIRIAKSIVPDIQWNTQRIDKGEVIFITKDEILQNLQNEDIIIGRKNKDLLQLFRQFLLKDKRKVKFRNIEMVNSLIKDLSLTIKEYIKLYNKGLNIDKQVHTLLDKYIQDNPNYTDTELEEQKDSFIKLSLETEKNLLQTKKLCKSKYNLDYLLICMKEYLDKGEYEYNSDTSLTEYYDTISSFIEDYRQNNASPLVIDFISYLKHFLTAGLNENIPTISSVHAMKGGECDNVFIYDYPKFPYKFNKQSSEDQQQELNLKYVAITRAKKKLFLVKVKENNEDDIELNTKCQSDVKYLLNKYY